MKEKVPEELQKLQKYFLSCYKEYDCYLFPSPGDKVTGRGRYNGDLAGLFL